MQRSLVELIAAKRDGLSLSKEEVRRFIESFSKGELADYQMTAFLMAVFFRGMSDDETVGLTEAMLHSGSVIDLSNIAAAKVDKHSTGGVGDKVSIALAPLVAACGVPVPMVSGRGLGHTGGTLDKLEAIPGFRTDLDVETFKRVVAEVGTCMIGQTKDIAPADKRIYALRDVTATVECIPLIVASILSKKLAEGIDALVLDVKVGNGAFMKDLASATKLAEALVRVGKGAGKRVSALLTDMNQPLGIAIGNANETREAFELLSPDFYFEKSPRDLFQCTQLLAREMLLQGGAAKTAEEADQKLEHAVRSGKAIEVAERMVAAHHGDPSVVRAPEKLNVAKVVKTVKAARSGFVGSIQTIELGLTGVSMGAGRTRADQKVDPAVGLMVRKKIGDKVSAGETLCEVYVHSDHAGDDVMPRILAAFGIADAPPAPRELLLGRVD